MSQSALSPQAERLAAMRHSLAHVLAQAVQTLWPDTKISIGPPIETGCYYDFLFSSPVSDTDFSAIEKQMKKIIHQNQTFRCDTLSVDEALEYWREKQQPFKVELIEDLREKEGVQTVTHYVNVGPGGKDVFTDLCRGGHVDSTKEIPVDGFKIMSLAGAYWRGDEKREQLTRLYVAAFESAEELQQHLHMLEEAKRRDHRKVGEEMDLFHFDESIGKGLPMWLPNGNVIKEELERWAKETETQWGYDRVTTPIITKEDLFYTSGHLPLYKESMYAPIQIEDESYYIKPMNCPFHHKAFAARPKSYRDLPVRFAEYGWCHRYEDSGSLFGLMRVRGMQMNDAHIYVSREEAVEEFVRVIRLHEHVYNMLGIEHYQMELALRDPKKMDKYHGDESDWQDAERMTMEAMEISGVPFTVVHEGAAFYGPKMDFQITSSIGRTFTASTNQLDLYMGKRFGLQYTDKDGSLKTPVIIHRAPLGTHERFIGFLIEHFGGHFPLWLSPVQVAVLAVARPHEEYAARVGAALLEQGIRVQTLPSDDSLGKRIRECERLRVPYVLVLGDAEQKDSSVTVRNGRTKQQVHVSLDAFLQSCKETQQTRSKDLTIGEMSS